MFIKCVSILFCFLGIIQVVAAEKPLDATQALEIVKTLDFRQRNSGDYTANAFIKETEKGKEPRLLNSTVYRRDLDSKFMILFVRPKEESGKAYLKIDKNLWNYDPTTGKWERRTEREKIGGTNSRRSDFDESRLAQEYDVKYESGGTFGKFKTHQLTLKVKDGVDVTYPVLKLWVEQTKNNLLKREEYAASGKLMRTTMYPRWNKIYSKSKKADVFFPEEIRIFDELEKGNSTLIVFKEIKLDELAENIFTKAWVESKSR